MSVDVVIVNWNGGAELVTTVTSALRFGGRPIIVDNASTNLFGLDDVAKLPGVTVIRNSRNAGFASGCNSGAAGGAGSVVLLLNPDAEIVEGTAADLERAFDETGAMVLGTRLEDIHGRAISSARRAPTLGDIVADLLRVKSVRDRLVRLVRGRPSLSVAAGSDWILGAAMALRRSDWDRLGGLDEGFFLWYEDVDLGTRARGAGGTIAVADNLLVRHVGASTWSRLPRRRRQWLRARAIWRYGRRHFGWSGAAAVGPAVGPALALGVVLDAAHWLVRRP